MPGMKRNTDANVIIDAIAYARLGHDNPSVNVQRRPRRVVATYQSLYLGQKNIEYAIACAGFDANNTPANLGREDAVPHGWLPVRL